MVAVVTAWRVAHRDDAEARVERRAPEGRPGVARRVAAAAIAVEDLAQPGAPARRVAGRVMFEDAPMWKIWMHAAGSLLALRVDHRGEVRRLRIVVGRS